MNVPFDIWMREMTDLADASRDVEEFWRAAMEALIHRTNIVGVSWQVNDETIMVGEEGNYLSHLPLPEIIIHLHAERKILPTMSFNLWLLARVALEFRLSKEREARLSVETTMRSIHELGARTTHDIKNLLHVIGLLCAPGKMDSEDGFSNKKKEQLRSLARRLETSLAQLTGESLDVAKGGLLPVKVWWDAALRRNDHANVVFCIDDSAATLDFEVPAELFDQALENLLHNALRKQGLEGELHISVILGLGPSLTVKDDGSPIPETMQSKLFSAPLPSSSGMGIGLFQLATNCTKHGYEIFVAANDPGEVAFRMEKSPESQSNSSIRRSN